MTQLHRLCVSACESEYVLGFFSLVVRARLSTDLLPAGSGAAGHIHIGLVGQVSADRSCKQRTQRHLTHADYRGFPLDITGTVLAIFSFSPPRMEKCWEGRKI